MLRGEDGSVKNFSFKTINELDILHEAQSSILNRMIGILEDMQENPWDSDNYKRYKKRSSQFDELNARMEELKENKEALSA